MAALQAEAGAPPRWWSRRAPRWRDLILLVLPLAALGLAARGSLLLPPLVGIPGLALIVARIVIGSSVSSALLRAALALVWAASVLPVWLVTRRRPGTRPRTGEWSDRPAMPTGARRVRPFAPPVRRPMGPLSQMTVAIGALAVLALANLTIGLLLTRAGIGKDATPPLGGVVSDEPVATTTHDPRADSAAMRDLPWADQHLREIQQVPHEYWPFEIIRPLRFSGETLTVDGWVRRSYRAPDVGRVPVTIALYGGSAAFGEGQRDEHTIASEITRLAEAEGLEVVVTNYGQRGFTAWQGTLLFEDTTAVDDRPDVAVFYDGANEVGVARQTSIPGVPSRFSEDRVARLISGQPLLEETEPSMVERATDWYADHSAVHLLLGADRSSQPDPALSGKGEYCRSAWDVYRRAREVARAVATTRDVATLHYWQPVLDSGGRASTCNGSVDGTTIDISDALDGHDDVYLDGVHTNEVGARLVAERMWESLEPVVRAAR